MPTSMLNIDDFAPFSVTCELRFKNAYLIFDRTGKILEDLREHFTELEISSASPQQTGFTAQEGTFGLEIGACRFTSSKLDGTGEAFAKQGKLFFDTVVEQLNVTVFTRIGLRYIARKEFKSEEEAKVSLASLALANLGPTKRFNISENPIEAVFRWEDKDLGVLFRLKAETTTVKLSVPPELRASVPPLDKKIIGITLDVDYYTVAPVDREQWEPDAWVRQKLRMIKKEADGILAGGGK
jgi:uncharacterized protein (TIGR04255 family)